MKSSVILFSDIDHLVVKHNNLIEAKTQLSEVENKVVSLAVVLTRLHEKSSDRDMSINSTIRIYASDYMKTYSVGTTAAYNALNDAMDTLYNRSFTMTSEDGTPTIHRWIQSKGKGEKLNDGYIQFAFSTKAIELITGLEKGNYTSYGIERISRLKGNYSGRIYELIIKYKNIKGDDESIKTTKVFELENFRGLVGIEDHEYRDTKKPGATRLDNFKKKVIDPAIVTINAESDITVTPIYHRTGRSITGLSFSFEFKKDYVPAFLRNEIAEPQEPGKMRTVGDETKDPKKTKPKDAPAIPTVKDDKEHLGTDLRTEDLENKPNPVQDHIVDFKDLVKPVPGNDKPKVTDVYLVSERTYEMYVNAGGTLTIDELTEKCRSNATAAGAFVLGEIGRLKKEKQA